MMQQIVLFEVDASSKFRKENENTLTKTQEILSQCDSYHPVLAKIVQAKITLRF